MLFFILLAVALLGALTAAVRGLNNSESANIDSETLAIHVADIRSYVSELERAVAYINQNGVSEDDIRFAMNSAHDEYGDLSADSDPEEQVFHSEGGGALYRSAPSDITSDSWEFYGTSAVPGVGSGRADLIAVLPNVSQQFCDRINEINNQSGTPSDTSVCVHSGAAGRFNASTTYASSPNTFDTSSFEQDATISAVRPAPQACVTCSTDGTRHFYHVLLAR